MSVSIFKITTQKVIDTLESDEIQALSFMLCQKYIRYIKKILLLMSMMEKF